MQGIHGEGQLRAEALPSLMMNTWGAECIPSPSTMTNRGKTGVSGTPGLGRAALALQSVKL